ncbi:hypothetical protein B0J13DRAFT_647101 [Dactylonectria estremocensis]|uniref:Uncharacterized protein n=1 Tax=Dactylonectria estremocensis TaxID=1079267 RepID=A0A9P9ILN9_9HYPO|nr:hypothetical protein B0J13DRAFT_647101 [Dactylonectria estremocensis]
MAPQSQELKFYLLKDPLAPGDGVHMLGCVVEQFLNPTRNFTPPSPVTTLTPDVFGAFLLEPHFEYDAHITTTASKDGSFWAKVKGVFSAAADAAVGGSSETTSPCLVVRRLKREPSYFNALKAIPEVRSELLSMCPVGGKVYLIVGTMGYRTATVKQAGNQSVRGTLAGTLPTGTHSAATIGVPLAVGEGGIEIGAERTSSSAWTKDYELKASEADGGEAGEHVFALACREVTRDWIGLGMDIKMRTKQPEYRGGQHYGAGDESDSNEDGDNDEAENMAAQGLYLVDSASEVSQWEAESTVFKFAS